MVYRSTGVLIKNKNIKIGGRWVKYPISIRDHDDRLEGTEEKTVGDGQPWMWSRVFGRWYESPRQWDSWLIVPSLPRIQDNTKQKRGHLEKPILILSLCQEYNYLPKEMQSYLRTRIMRRSKGRWEVEAMSVTEHRLRR